VLVLEYNSHCQMSPALRNLEFLSVHCAENRTILWYILNHCHSHPHRALMGTPLMATNHSPSRKDKFHSGDRRNNDARCRRLRRNRELGHYCSDDNTLMNPGNRHRYCSILHTHPVDIWSILRAKARQLWLLCYWILHNGKRTVPLVAALLPASFWN